MTSQSTAPKPFCFVLMPFDAAFGDVYQIGIREAYSAAGAYCERVDEQIFHELILDRIYNQIAKADLVIADMTGRNPNVFYEVGYAHALGKPTVLITKKADDIPFDLKHFPHIVYGDSLVNLRDELAKRVQWHIANPVVGTGDNGGPIELFIDGKPLSSDSAVHGYPHNELPNVILTLKNASFTMLDSDSFRIGVITDRHFYHCHDANQRSATLAVTVLPNGDRLHMLPDFRLMFPEEFTSFHLVFANVPKDGVSFSVTVRTYTQSGVRDYLLTMKRMKEVKPVLSVKPEHPAPAPPPVS